MSCASWSRRGSAGRASRGRAATVFQRLRTLLFDSKYVALGLGLRGADFCSPPRAIGTRRRAEVRRRAARGRARRIYCRREASAAAGRPMASLPREARPAGPDSARRDHQAERQLHRAAQRRQRCGFFALRMHDGRAALPHEPRDHAGDRQDSRSTAVAPDRCHGSSSAPPSTGDTADWRYGTRSHGGRVNTTVTS